MNHIISELGEIKIHKKLISQVAETATLSVEGVRGLACSSKGWLAKILKCLKINCIKVDTGKDLKIEVPIIVKYGYNIPQVAGRVQEEVLNSLFKSLNIESAYIIVKIKGLAL